MGSNGKIVVLTGAGASQALNIPAMSGMFEAFIQKKKSGLSADDKRICEIFVNKLGVTKDLEEFLLAANTIVDTQNDSPWKLTETIVSPTLKGKRLQSHRQTLRKFVSDTKRTRRNILNFMSQTCFRFNREKACELLTGFVNSVANKGYPVYTTNYDFSLEYAAEESGILVHDNFALQGRRQIWNSQISFPIGGGLTIVKLHGSVTWYADTDGSIEKVEADTTVNTAGRTVERLVVFPTRFKDIYDQNFFALYSHFLAALSTAECLVVVGHSLRDEYIRAAIIEQVRIKHLRVVIIDPIWPQTLSADFRPERIGSSGQLTHIPQAFEEFSDELAHILGSEEPDGVGKACASTLRQIKHKKNKLKINGKIGALKPHETISVKVSVDAYIPRNRRPVIVRGWLQAKFTNSAGEQRAEGTKTYMNSDDPILEIGLSGKLDQPISLELTIPKVTSWLQFAETVTLKVALLENVRGSPKILSPDKIIAEDARELRYKS